MNMNGYAGIQKLMVIVIVFQAVKEIAKELFVEVIDEMATQLSTNFLDLIRMVTIEANDILHDVINDTTKNLLRSVFRTALLI